MLVVKVKNETRRVRGEGKRRLNENEKRKQIGPKKLGSRH